YNLVEKAYHANRRLTAKESDEVESFDVKYSKMRLKEVKGELKPSDLKSLPHADEQKAVDAIDLLISWYDMFYGAGPGTLSPDISSLQQLADYEKEAKQALGKEQAKQ
ncbi:MAG: hypothetical protein K6T83_21685, partial [Alicyclobacillus sp.]|nr:hypothetical protein [Alicyclobacillus sp.]